MPRLIFALAMGAAAGCANTANQAPPPLVGPAVTARVRSFEGTPLSGPLADDGAMTTHGGDALAIKVTFFAMEKIPSQAFAPLGPQVRLIIARREDAPVLPSAGLTLGARLVDLESAGAMLADLRRGKYGRAVLISTESGALPAGATVAFSLAESKGEPDVIPGEIAARRIELEFHRTESSAGAGDVESAILLDDFVSGSSPVEFEDSFAAKKTAAISNNNRRGFVAPRAKTVMAAAAAPVFQSELAIFDRPEGHWAFAVVAPIRFENSPCQAVAAIVEISPAPADGAFASLLARTIEEIHISSLAAAREANLIRVDPTDWPGLSSAVESLAFLNRQRAGLVFLADQTGAGITEDVALTAGDTIVSRLAAAVSKAIAAAPTARTRKAVGWILDRTTYQMLLQIQSGGKLPAELASILAQRTGQAGRNAGTLDEVLANATSQQDMQNRLAGENYIFLEDSSPSARVRAFDFLTSRQLAPPGYDPLAAPRERRAALEQAEQTAANQAAKP